jgi:hypothetical protein
MSSTAIIGLCVTLNIIAFGRVMWLYAWPRLRRSDREHALHVLVLPHMFRFVGLGFLMPGVVSPELSPAFANPAAYGDLIAALLAIAASLSLSARTAWAIALVWLLNVEGALDLLYAFYNGIIRIGLPPGVLGAGVVIPTVIVPPLLVTHWMMFWLLLRPRDRAAGRSRAAQISASASI